MTQYIDNDPFFSKEEWEQLETKEINNSMDSVPTKEDIENYRKMLEEQIEAQKSEDKNRLDLWVDDNTPKKGVVTKEIWDVPMPSHNDYLKSKDADFKVYSTINLISNYGGKANNMETQRYIYKNALDYNEVASLSGVSESTVKRAFNKLKKVKINGADTPLISIENTPNGIVYKLNYGYDNKYYVTIPNDLLKYLIDTSNSDMIKLYVFFKVQLANGQKEMQREFIADSIGFNSKNTKILDKLSNMTTDLELKGLIYKSKRLDFVYDEKSNREVPKYKVTYGLHSYEHWVSHKNSTNKSENIDVDIKGA